MAPFLFGSGCFLGPGFIGLRFVLFFLIGSVFVRGRFLFFVLCCRAGGEGRRGGEGQGKGGGYKVPPLVTLGPAFKERKRATSHCHSGADAFRIED